MSKDKDIGRLLQCDVCGGTQGTLVKYGQTGYRHQRSQDCERHRKAETRKKNILAQKKSIPQEETQDEHTVSLRARTD